MSKEAPGKYDYCLNRLALFKMKNPYEINPFKYIGELFNFYNPGDLKKIFRNYCEAALSEQYISGNETPGKLLYFYDQLEGLIEACYLISVGNKYRSPAAGKEITNAFEEIVNFFRRYSLLEWKRNLHLWLDAGLSGYSVIDSIEPTEILSYYCQIEDLFDSSFMLSRHQSKT